MPILNLESAVSLARDRVDRFAQEAGYQFEILLNSTREIEQGWVFFYNTADFVRTKDPKFALAGNGPVLVTREGTIHELPSAIAWEDAVKRLRTR